MLIKLALPGFDPLALTTLRLWLAAALLGVFAVLAGQAGRIVPRDFALVVVAGVFGNALPFFLIAWGEKTAGAGLAAILMGLMPISTLVIAHFLTNDEPLTARRLSGVLIGFAGLAVLTGPALLSHLGEGTAHLAILPAALSSGSTAVIPRRILHLPRLLLASLLLFVGAVLITPVALLAGEVRESASWTPVVALMILAILPTGLASLLMFKLIERQGAGFFGQVNLLVPVAGVGWAFLILGEEPQPRAVAALALILIGVAIARGKATHNVNASILPSKERKP